MTSILIADTNGMPKDWVDFETAVCYKARDKVVWREGEVVTTFRGGKNSQGNQSTIDVHSILFVTGPLFGDEWFKRTSIHVERGILYGRDQNLCAYCGRQ